MSIVVTVVANDGRQVKVTSAQAQAITALNNTRKGGCASVVGYRPSTNWIEPPVQDIQLITHFSTRRLYERRLEALQAIEYADVAVLVAQDEKFSEMSAGKCLELFEQRKEMLVQQVKRSLEDAPKNAHQKGHERCYVHVGDVKLHLQTEKVDGIKVPIKDERGYVICDTIMIPYLELNVTTREEGIRKVVNSGAPVRMGDYIQGCLNKRSVIYKTLSLKEDNFEAFRIDRMEFLPEDVATFGDLIMEEAA